MKSSNLDSPSILSSSSSGRRDGNFSTSPEFEFWMTRNPVPQPDLVAADDLFVDGVLQPLDLLKPDPTKPTSDPETQSGLGHGLLESDPKTVSKRWKDIFKKSGDRKIKNEEKEKKREKKGNGANGLSSAELNINIWPFSRSRSAGTGGNRPAPSNRKISSAPCSRSNSAGESKSRKWPSSPSRGGSEGISRIAEKSIKKGAVEGGGKVKVLNMNVPACIGYKSHLGCRSDEIERSAVVGGGFVAGGNRGSAVHGVRNMAGDGGRGNSNLFNLRGLFTKKVY